MLGLPWSEQGRKQRNGFRHMCGMHSTGESYDDFFFSFCKEKLWFSEENREKLERKEVLKRVKICNSH